MRKQLKLINILCICVSIQFQKEARDTQDLVNRLDKELDQKYNPEFKDVYQVEGLIDDIDVCVFFFFFMSHFSKELQRCF